MKSLFKLCAIVVINQGKTYGVPLAIRAGFGNVPMIKAMSRLDSMLVDHINSGKVYDNVGVSKLPLPLKKKTTIELVYALVCDQEIQSYFNDAKALNKLIHSKIDINIGRTYHELMDRLDEIISGVLYTLIARVSDRPDIYPNDMFSKDSEAILHNAIVDFVRYNDTDVDKEIIDIICSV